MSPEYDFHLRILADNPQEASALREILLNVKGISLVEPITPQAQDTVERVEFTLPAMGQTLQPEMLFDPSYALEILRACLAMPSITGYYDESLITRTRDLLVRGYGPENWYGFRGLRVSMQELLSTDDNDLLKLRHFGPKCLALFKDATKPLINKYAEILGKNE